MSNDAQFAVTGYVATQPKSGTTKSGAPFLFMRVAWTPRAFNKATGGWTDQQTSFVSVMCYRKVAENATKCLRRGDAITLRGTIQVRDYVDQAGEKRLSVDVVADTLGHDMSRGTSHFSKATQRAEQTAEEFARSASAERAPLPGDVAARLASEQRSEEPDGWTAEAPPYPGDDADDVDDMPDPADLDDESDPADLAREEPVAELAGRRA